MNGATLPIRTVVKVQVKTFAPEETSRVVVTLAGGTAAVAGGAVVDRVVEAGELGPT